nr:pxmp2/4 family protein 2 [Quercus suber]
MLKLWKWYQNSLAVHPVKTQVISSAIIWGVGDFAAQTITYSTAKNKHQIQDKDKELKINWKRVATTSLFGFGFVGPVGHFWYEGLDRFIKLLLLMQPKSFRFVATKVALDGVIFGPLDLLVFFTYMGFTTGKSVPQIKEDVKRDFLPALILEGGIWPILQVANFRYIPARVGDGSSTAISSFIPDLAHHSEDTSQKSEQEEIEGKDRKSAAKWKSN